MVPYMATLAQCLHARARAQGARATYRAGAPARARYRARVASANLDYRTQNLPHMVPYVPKGYPLVDPPQTPPIAHAVSRAVAPTMPNSNIGKSPPVGGG